MTSPDEDVALVRRWFQRLQLYVQAVDFISARPLFAEDVITFGRTRPLYWFQCRVSVGRSY